VWPWAVLAVVAPGLPLLIDVPPAFASLAHDLATADGPVVRQGAVAVAVSVPAPFTSWFTRLTGSGLAIVVPAVAFLVPAERRRAALIAAGAVLAVLALAAVYVSTTAAFGSAVRAGTLAICYAVAIAAAVRAYRLGRTPPLPGPTR
jgi:hypothetical protein